MRKPWTDLLDVADLSRLAEEHKFADRFGLADRMSEAAWVYQRRTDSSAVRANHKQQKHFLKITKNRAAKEDLKKWRSKEWPKPMTFDDAVNLGVAGLQGLEGNPADVHRAADKALNQLTDDRGGAPRDYPLDFWFRSLIVIYESRGKRRAAASIRVARDGFDAPGPFLRFVIDACVIAKIDFCPQSSRSKLKRLIREVRTQKQHFAERNHKKTGGY